MKVTGVIALALTLLAVAAVSSTSPSSTARAEQHLRQACEIVWSSEKPQQIERCTRRAMAALGNDDRLRDNELKRMLVDSEHELEACRVELAALKGVARPAKSKRSASRR